MRISLDEALSRTLACGAARRVPTATVPVEAALGRVLREDVAFLTSLPPFSYAQMDGYALSRGASADERFDIVGESRAGAPSATALPAGAVAISTGAMMPHGMTAVVPWEDVERAGDVITLRRAVREGQFIRRLGEDARAGDVVATSGMRLGAVHVAALAVAERAQLMVSRAPTVALFLTGDELRAPGSDAASGTIVDTNGPMLIAMLRRAGAEIVAVHRVPDVDGALEKALADCVADVAITIGGAADGEHDHVARAFARMHAEWIFRGVAIKPGKPIGLAQQGARLLVALPGNPGSAYVTAALFVLPLLRALEGDLNAAPSFIRASTASALSAAQDRAVLHYGALSFTEGKAVFEPARGAASGSVAGLLGARCLALVLTQTPVQVGALVDVLIVDP